MLSELKSCCSKFLHRYSEQHRSVLCLNWILPIRIIAIGSLLIHMVYRFYSPPQTYTFFLIIFHIIIAMAMLNECKRSEDYHQTIRELNMDDDSPKR